MSKSGKAKLPKSVAGFKVPKALRKSELIEALTASPSGRQLLADALVAGAAAAVAVLAKAPAPADNRGSDPLAVDEVSDTQGAAGHAAEVVSALLNAVADALRPAPPPDPVAQATAESPAAKPARRPRTRAAKATTPEPAASDSAPPEG